ncbi:MAG: hypothetical protein LOD87_11360, partial [Planifilum fulgidum]
QAVLRIKKRSIRNPWKLTSGFFFHFLPGRDSAASKDFHPDFFFSGTMLGQAFSAFLSRLEIFIFRAKSLISVGDLLIM